MVRKIRPAGKHWREHAANDLAQVVWDIREELKGTPWLWLVDEMCDRHGIVVTDKDAA